ncbi:MAG: TetR/AcrR family transcriptional regulator [Proteobacteria bacterium]|nr:TetR/AcrR family transcriptional regulator [Pseudomonadota bacterium]
MAIAQQARAERRERALAAARSLVSEDGVAALSMRKLAERAGLAVNTVYSVLGPSRDAILETLVDDGIGRLLARFEAAPEAPPLEAARRLLEHAVELPTSDPTLFRSVFLAERSHPGVRRWGGRLAIEAGLRVLRSARRGGWLRRDAQLELLAEEILRGYRAAAHAWAGGELDDAGFRDRALYSLHVCLLAAASEKSRFALTSELRRIERRLRRQGG